MRSTVLAIAALLAAAPASAANRPEPANFIFAGGDNADEIADLLARPDIDGVQIIYNWRQLEPREGEYDFSKIERDLASQRRGTRNCGSSFRTVSFSRPPAICPITSSPSRDMTAASKRR